MEKIILVEDDFALRNIINEILEKEGYIVFSLANGREAIQLFDHVRPDLIISDIFMPEIDGFELLKFVRSKQMGVTIPFLFISAFSNHEYLNHARYLGIDDYLVKPFTTEELITAVRVRLDRRKAVMLFDIHDAYSQTVLMLANVIEARDSYTRGHVERVRDYALALGHSLNWRQEDLTVLEFGAVLHDIGKVAIPNHILNKARPLKPREWKVIQGHVLAGVEMLRGIKHLETAIPYVAYHHERWDGSGYPYGLKGDAIPIEGRILAIVDSFDAMMTDRSYRKRKTKAAALDELESGRAQYFDSHLVDIFLKCIS